MRVQSTSLTARQFWCGSISVTGWAIACRRVPWMRFRLKSERRRHMTRQPFSVRRNWRKQSLSPDARECVPSRCSTESRHPGQSVPASFPSGRCRSSLPAWLRRTLRMLTFSLRQTGTAYAYGNFHADFIRGRITLIGCPKLDAVDYTEKLTAIFASHNIRSVTVARMEVPCCGGIEYAVQNAIAASGKDISCRVAVIGIDGTILEERVS